MPIEDALILISRNFEAYMKGEHSTPDDPSEMTLLDRHPTAVQVIMFSLLNAHILRITFLDRIQSPGGESPTHHISV